MKNTVRGAFGALAVYRVIVILVATFVISTIVVPGFFAVSTFSLLLDRGATMGIVAVGLTVLLIAGQIDLSTGSTLALAGVVTIGLQPVFGTATAALLGALVGALIGLINGIIVVGFHVNSLVSTLAMMLAVRAVAHWATGSTPIGGNDTHLGLVLNRTFGEIFTARSLLFVVALLVLHFWLTRTVPGRNLFAVGSNPDAARASGIRSGRYILGGFILTGTCSGVAGVLQSLMVNTGSPVFGESVMLMAIVAVVIGGTRIEGGVGSALGTIGGVVTIAALTTAMEYQSVPSYMQDVVTGAILVLLILLDRLVADSARRKFHIAALFRRRPATTKQSA